MAHATRLDDARDGLLTFCTMSDRSAVPACMPIALRTRRRLPLGARDGSIRAMPIHVFQYPKCSTCRKALKWLGEHGVKYTESDLVATPISLAKLRDLHKRSGLPIRRFFNTSGESYRNGGFGKKLPAMSDAEALAALAGDGKLVKRPIVDAGKTVLVGFDEDVYAETLE